MFEILKKIQGDLSAFRSEMGQFQATTDQRFEHIEGLIRKQRRDHAAMLIMMRAVVGDFDARVTKLEDRVTVLQSMDG